VVFVLVIGLAGPDTDPVFVLVLGLWLLGGLGWIAAGEGWSPGGTVWYELVGIGVFLVAVGMAILGASTLLDGDQLLGASQLVLAAILTLQAYNHYHGGNITELIDATPER
jgi:hypothetical protein